MTLSIYLSNNHILLSIYLFIQPITIYHYSSILLCICLSFYLPRICQENLKRIISMRLLLSFYLSIVLSIYPSVYMSIYLSTQDRQTEENWRRITCITLTIFLSIHIIIHISFCIIYLSIYLSTQDLRRELEKNYLFAPLTIFLSIYSIIHLSFYLSIYLPRI